jgi:predicted nucleotidyltransferase
MIIPIMGNVNDSSSANFQKPMMSQGHSGIADALFSFTQQRLLSLLFGQPERSFYVNELITLAGSGSGAVQRELQRLTQTGLLTVTTIGNQKHYQANAESPIFPELRSIVLKTFGAADRLRHALRPIESAITSAFIYGSVAKGEDHAGSDMDIMVVSDILTLGDIFSVMQPLEGQLGRKIHVTLYTSEEFSKRRKDRNSFLTKVLTGTIILLIGRIDDYS